MMEYYTSRQCLNNEIILTPIEHRILIALSSNNAITYNDLSNYALGYMSMASLRKHIRNMRKKGFNIITIYGFGCKLKDVINFK